MEFTIFFASRTPPYIASTQVRANVSKINEAVSKIPEIVSVLTEKGFIEDDFGKSNSNSQYYIETSAFGLSEIYEDTQQSGNADTFYKLIATNEKSILLQSLENKNNWNIAHLAENRFKKVELVATH